MSQSATDVETIAIYTHEQAEPVAEVVVPRPPKAPKPPMEERIAAEQEADPLLHDWIVAAEVPVDTKTAKHAELRQSFRAHEGLRIDALEVYCRRCRRPLEEVIGSDCAAKIDNTHLIGGDQSVRAKRKVPQPLGRIVQGPKIQRRGMDAHLAGYSK